MPEWRNPCQTTGEKAIFTRITAPFTSPENSANQLRVHSHLYQVLLTRVTDPFDPDPLWDHRYSGGEAITESKTGRQDLRLQKALYDCPHIEIGEKKDHRGVAQPEERVFTDVMLWVPQCHYRAAMMQGGSRGYHLIEKLQARHLEDWKALLWRQRTPSYCVMPDPSLADDEVLLQFGLGVFVPRAEDNLLATVQYAGQALTAWDFWLPNGGSLQRPAGWYDAQPFLLLGAARQAALVMANVENGYLILTQQGQGFGDQRWLADAEVTEKEANSQQFSFPILPASESEMLSLTVHYQHLPQSTQGEKTRIGHETVVQGYFLQLQAIALPKDSWQLWLDAQGKVFATVPQISPPSFWRKIIPRASTGEYGWILQGGGASIRGQRSDQLQVQKSLCPPFTLTLPHEQSLVLEAPPLDTYYALLPLTQPIPKRLPHDPCVLGRDNGEAGARIHLDTLYDLQDMATINLSRNHLKVERKEDCLHITQTGQSASYCLDQDKKLIKTLVAHQNQAEIALDQYLLLGCYLLRFGYC